MNITNKRLLAAMLAAAVCTTALSGCGNHEEKEATNLAVVYSCGQGTAWMDTSDMEDILTDAYLNADKTGAMVYTISLEGDCKAESFNVKPEENHFSASRKQKHASENAQKVLDYLDGMRAESEQVSPLDALSLAVDKVEGKEGSKHIYAYMSGISTVEKLDMSGLSCIHEMSVEDTVSQLKDAMLIPDFSDIDSIDVYGLGQTAAPQAQLTEKDQAVLQQLWTEIFKQGGASVECVRFHSADVKNEERDGELPAVKTVPVIPDKITFDEHKLDSTSLFVSNEATLLDEAAARKALESDVKQLTDNPNMEVVVLGTTATGKSLETCQKLSEARSETIKALLISMGVQEKQITTVGMAYRDPYHTDDLDHNGNLIEQEAAKNRAVYLIDIAQARQDGII